MSGVGGALMMDDIGEFAKRTADQFLEHQRTASEPFKLRLPRDVVETFIRMVYHASLIPDEGRYPVLHDVQTALSAVSGTKRGLRVLAGIDD
jgi:hypothetical protein